MVISCNGTVIKATDSVKYLGATLDQSLSCDSMARSVIKKANSRLKFLYRKRQFLTHHTKKLLVMSLIQCHFDYACSFWYSALTQSLKNRLQTTQNKMIRFVMDLDNRSHICPNLFQYLNWLPVEKRVNQITLSHVFKVKSGTAPDYLQDSFVPISSVHNHSTRLRVTACASTDSTFSFSFRDSGCFSLPKVKGFGKKSFAYLGCNLWNDLPFHIKHSSASKDFNAAVKSHFLRMLAK